MTGKGDMPSPDRYLDATFGEGGYLGMERQLHDCGIIYHPLKPYLLCVMTRGEKIADLENAIRDISKWIFERVNKDTLSERY